MRQVSTSKSLLAASAAALLAAAQKSLDLNINRKICPFVLGDENSSPRPTPDGRKKQVSPLTGDLLLLLQSDSPRWLL